MSPYQMSRSVCDNFTLVRCDGTRQSGKKRGCGGSVSTSATGSVTTSKCTIRCASPHHPIIIDKQTVEAVDSFKYFGLTPDNKLSFDHHITDIQKTKMAIINQKSEHSTSPTTYYYSSTRASSNPFSLMQRHRTEQ